MRVTGKSFFLIFNSAFPGLVFSQEFLLGQVLKVNEKEIELVVDREENQESETKSKQRVLVRIAKENFLPKHEDKAVFPECVKAGNRIRIWGHWEKDKQDVLLAQELDVQAEAATVTESIEQQKLPAVIIGSSKKMQELLSMVCRIAPTEWSALIRGETGTGKELIADEQ